MSDADNCTTPKPSSAEQLQMDITPAGEATAVAGSAGHARSAENVVGQGGRNDANDMDDDDDDDDASGGESGAGDDDDDDDDNGEGEGAERDGAGARNGDDTEDMEPEDQPLIEPSTFESQLYMNEKNVGKVVSKYDEKDRLDQLKKQLTISADIMRYPRGIQSVHSSSSTDCLLFVMFAFNDSFDSMFKGSSSTRQSPLQILKHKIVIPLRKIGFVGGKRIMELLLALHKSGKLSFNAISKGCTARDILDNFLRCNLLPEPLFKAVPSKTKKQELKKKSIKTNVVTVTITKEILADSIFWTTQQVLDLWSLGLGSTPSKPLKFCTKPNNLIIQIDRKEDPASPLVVQPLAEIVIDDCLHGIKRTCKYCDKVAPVEIECSQCFGASQKHMSISDCSFCDECNKKQWNHAGGSNEHDNQIPVASAWRKPVVKPSNEPETMESNEHSAKYKYELYAIICKNMTGHVAYVNTGVEFKFIRKIVGNYLASLEKYYDIPSTASSSDAAAAAAQPAEGQSAAAGAAEEGAAPAGDEPEPQVPNQLEDEHLWVYFDPGAVICEDSRGNYNVPQVSAVESFKSIVNNEAVSDKAHLGCIHPIVQDLASQHQYRILCESVIFFYRPHQD